MKALHLIQKDPELRPWPKEKGSSEYKSGYWKLTVERANEAIGANIFFHKRKIEASFFGGTITGFEIKENDPWKGRIIFTFESSPDLKGIKTDQNGWSMVIKIIA